MCFKKRNKRGERYLPLEDIKEINSKFLDEFESVKKRLNFIKDEATIKKFAEVLLSAYSATIELRTRERKVDYEIRLAKIEARADEQTPWRRGWWWRLLFRPLTNRAQDIIEERAEIEADNIHTAAETANKQARAKLQPERGKKLSKRELKRQLHKQLKTAIEQADSADVQGILNEPQGQPQTVESVQKLPQRNGQLQGQLSIDEIQPPLSVRRARPPRSCRKP